MKMKLIIAAALITPLLCCGGGLFAQNKAGRNPKAIPVSIYGTDDRKEFFEADRLMQKFAESTVALFIAERLPFDAATKSYKINGLTLRDVRNLDEKQRFGEQRTASFCSGALVSSDTIITAGHCLQPAPFGAPCDQLRIAFGYAVTKAGRNPSKLPVEEVYSCKRALRYNFDEKGPDYALVELDRAVTNHDPLAISRKNVEQGAEIAVIGYPCGLPVKIAANAHVRRVEAEKGIFVADLDTFYGNSGSPVFNIKTMKIEGILVRGDLDFVYPSASALVDDPNSPYVSPQGHVRAVGQDEGRGEDVTLISQVQQDIAPTKLERALDLSKEQKGGTGGRAKPIPAFSFPGSGQGAIQPAIYFPSPEPKPVEQRWI